ncbi:MAG: hypothetical protein JW797_01050, partial [Bradymonadales bacterium]|nr:hypothetical protein [Bradymonadales bacterium]
ALFVEVDIATLTTSATWRAIDVPYRFLGRNYIDDAGATITIQPGTILEFDSASGLRLNAGTLVAAGTDVDPITFTSASGNRKDWYGIGIASASEDNLLDHVIIENAGQTYSTINNSRSTNLYIANNAQVAITNSTFRNAGGATDNTGYGIYTETNTILTTFEDNSFDGNGAAVMRITAQQLGMIGQGNSFAGASTPANALFVEVDIATLTTSATWRAIDVPYRFLGRNYIDDGGATITIQPGTILEFDSASGLRLNAGTLRAPGTGDDPITFTSASGNSNDWYGIGIASGSANNLLDHVLIENAGQTYSTINNSRSTNLYVGTSGRIAVTNSAFDNSGGWGIYNQGTITDQAGDTIDPATQGNNSFDNNTSGAVGP